MTESESSTEFAPAARSRREKLEAQRCAAEGGELFTGIVSSMPDLLLVLNENRQIVYANSHALDFLGVTAMEDLLGLRPGEAINCLNSGAPGGCGTSEKCSACGMVLSILASQRGAPSSKECRILRNRGGHTEALDLKVTAAPVAAAGEKFTAFYIYDISHQKRRRALERIFFHDVLNTAGTLEGFSDVMTSEKDPEALRSFSGKVNRISQLLIEEIVAQRELLKAENGELNPDLQELAAHGLLGHLAEVYGSHECAAGKEIIVQSGPAVLLKTDRRLLSRVLVNMLKNALEASKEGEAVFIWVSAGDGYANFCVNNPAVMAKEVKLQVFNRSFSTKGEDRGLGTYSMKLISERYLKGKVSFDSEEGSGTTFTLKVPLGR